MSGANVADNISDAALDFGSSIRILAPTPFPDFFFYFGAATSKLGVTSVFPVLSSEASNTYFQPQNISAGGRGFGRNSGFGGSTGFGESSRFGVEHKPILMVEFKKHN